jgi:beta-glucan synthesis-associated protein KRE6
MGNLARPGYGATTDGMWPYTCVVISKSRAFSDVTTSYDSCDVGTFPNQTDKDGLGPAAALHSDASKDKYNFNLSWLSGQKLRWALLLPYVRRVLMSLLPISACTCPGEDHPGPVNSKGRGAPEIDIFEAEKNKLVRCFGRHPLITIR